MHGKNVVSIDRKLYFLFQFQTASKMKHDCDFNDWMGFSDDKKGKENIFTNKIHNGTCRENTMKIFRVCIEIEGY